MKKIPLIFVLCSLAACGGGNSETDSVASASGSSTLALATTTLVSPAAPAAVVDSSQFLADIYRDSLGEIQLSQLALQRGANQDVKNFAQRMIDHHTRMDTQFAQLAQSKNITLPTDLTADQRTQVERLSALSGAEFDLAYMGLNVATHEKDVLAAKQQAAQGTDAEVVLLADASLPLLDLHLAVAEEINNLLDPAAFLAAAYRDGLAEIQLSQLALQKADSTPVKLFAQRMIDDHTEANQRITALAQQKGVSLPNASSALQQDEVQRLAAFAGADFDKTYMDKNVVQHIKDVRQARQQSQQGRDTDVKNLAQQTLPTLALHLAEAYAIDRRIDASFLYRAYQDGNAEIQFGNLAVLLAANQQVKTFGQQMMNDHAASNQQIRQLAQQRNLALPSELSPEQLVAFVELLRRTDVNFDRRYMELNIGIHQEDIAQANEQLQSTSDADVRTLLQNALPILNAHLTRAQQVQQQLSTQPQP